MAGDIGTMLLSFMGGTSAVGLSYACTLLQLHLGLSFFIGAVSVMASAYRASQPNAKASAGRPEAIPAAVEDVGKQLLTLAAFTLVQVPEGDWNSQGIGFSTLLCLLLSVIGYAFTLFCSNLTFSGVKILRLWSYICYIVPTFLLLFAPLPGGVQLAVASGVIRLGLAAEVIRASALAFGVDDPEDSAVAEACSDVKDALHLAPLLGGLSIMEYTAWGGSALFSLPFQPSFYFALGLAAQVALVLVLHFACGGGLQAGSGACDRVAFLNRAAKGGICVGITGCLTSAALGLCEFSVSRSGISIQWGEPTVAAAIVLAKLSLLTQIFEFFAPEAQSAVSQESNGNHEEINGAAAPAAGLADGLKSITGRANALLLALVAMQLGSSQDTSIGALKWIMDMFAAPFRFGFVLCTAALILQVLMLFAFAAYHCDAAQSPEAPLDATGTLAWQPVSKTARKVVGMLRGFVLLLLHVGLFLGLLGLGLASWVALPLVFFMLLVVPMQDQPGLGLASASAYLKQCSGAFGELNEAYQAKRRSVAEAAAAQAAADLAAEDKKGRKVSDMTEQKKKTESFSSPQKSKAKSKARK